jgi:hypothetical protein
MVWPWSAGKLPRQENRVPGWFIPDQCKQLDNQLPASAGQRQVVFISLIYVTLKQFQYDVHSCRRMITTTHPAEPAPNSNIIIITASWFSDPESRFVFDIG